MNPAQIRAFMTLVKSTPADFQQLTCNEVKASESDIAPIYLMYAKGTGKGPSSLSDVAAYNYLLLYAPSLDALLGRKKKVRSVEVCCAMYL